MPPQCENRIDFVRTVQEPLGYKDVSTPMVYTHVLRRCGLGARSPAEALELGGLCLPGGAVAFLGVLAYLAARFNYPDVLDSPAATVFPSLLATGQQGRLVWAIYALLPLIYLPAGLAAYEALAPVQRGAMRLALLCAVVATIAMMLGLMRWPSVH